jgi:hypothetical protein
MPKKKKDEEEDIEEKVEKKKPKKGAKKKKASGKGSSKDKVPTVEEVLKDLEKDKEKEPKEEPEDEESQELEGEEDEDLEYEEPGEEEPEKEPVKKWTTEHLATRRLMMMANATPFGSLLAYLSLESKPGADREMVRFQIAQNLIVSLFTFWWFPIYAVIALIAIFKASAGECWEMPLVGPWAHYWVDREELVEE